MIREYNGKKLTSITKVGDFFDEKDNLEQIEEYKDLCERIKKSLGDKIETTKISP